MPDTRDYIYDSTYMKCSEKAIYKDSKQISGCLGCCGNLYQNEDRLQMSTGNFSLRWWECSKLHCANDHKAIHLLKIIELYTYNGWVLCYAIYASINLWKKKKNLLSGFFPLLSYTGSYLWILKVYPSSHKPKLPFLCLNLFH